MRNTCDAVKNRKHKNVVYGQTKVERRVWIRMNEKRSVCVFLSALLIKIKTQYWSQYNIYQYNKIIAHTNKSFNFIASFVNLSYFQFSMVHLFHLVLYLYPSYSTIFMFIFFFCSYLLRMHILFCLFWILFLLFCVPLLPTRVLFLCTSRFFPIHFKCFVSVLVLLVLLKFICPNIPNIRIEVQ